jgi:hypothetical protein
MSPDLTARAMLALALINAGLMISSIAGEQWGSALLSMVAMGFAAISAARLLP